MCNKSCLVLLHRPDEKQHNRPRLTFRMLICFLNRSENSFFLLAPSSSLLPPSYSSCLQGGTPALQYDPPPSRQPPEAPERPLPFETVALLAAFVEVRQVAERPSWFFLLGLSPGAERRRPLQLGPHQFGVPAKIAGPGAVRWFVPEELGDGGVAAPVRDVAKKKVLV